MRWRGTVLIFSTHHHGSVIFKRSFHLPLSLLCLFVRQLSTQLGTLEALSAALPARGLPEESPTEDCSADWNPKAGS